MNMIWLAILAILITALAGALWRRLLGRWDWPMLWACNTFLWGPGDNGEHAPRRSYIMATGALLTWPLWLVLPPLYAVIGGGLCLLFWAPGHQMEDDKKMLLRYGPFAVGWIVARHLKIVPWTVVGELVAGFLFWGTVTALCAWSYYYG